MVANGEKYDVIFIDADKENYIEYYELGLQLLQKDGIILADNSLCALLYDQESDMRSKRLQRLPSSKTVSTCRFTAARPTHRYQYMLFQFCPKHI